MLIVMMAGHVKLLVEPNVDVQMTREERPHRKTMHMALKPVELRVNVRVCRCA